MKKLLFISLSFILVGNMHANLLDKFPLTPKQTLVVGALVGAGAAALRYCYFYPKFLEETDIISGHMATHTTEDGNIISIQLLDNETPAQICHEKICRVEDDETKARQVFDCKNPIMSINKLICTHESTYLGIRYYSTITYNSETQKVRSSAEPILFSYPILRYLNYLLYPVAYFSKTEFVKNQ